ncbi:MAG: response regulator [Thermodesulfobacteriota bacterium]|nr:response regulator [Thermodesulfobacteriota bacterium]
MKKLLIFAFFLFFVPLHAQALDYMVDFLAEKYREEPAGPLSAEKIYHTLQVDSELGARLLILKGNDSRYRIWLRQYLVTNDKLILKVPDSEDRNFRQSRAYETDVSMVHPVDRQKWPPDDPGFAPTLPFEGQKHILIVDSSSKRRRLLELVVKDLGYPVTVSSSGKHALNMFRGQPNKFCMVIMTNDVPEITGAELISTMIKTEPDIPVILGTGYNRSQDSNVDAVLDLSDKIVVKPVLLRELPKTIIHLLGEKA